MNKNAIIQLQTSLGLPATGVLDAATVKAMNGAVSSAIKSDPNLSSVLGSNSADSIVNAYNTGDWSGVTDVSGKPFTSDQQQAAVAQATTALSPQYEEQKSYDTSNAADALGGVRTKLGRFLDSDAKSFAQDKNDQDQSAANNGVLFSGSRFQKLNDLRTSYDTRAQNAATDAASSIAGTARDFQYKYGAPGAASLSQYYQPIPTNSYNANVAGGKVTTGTPLSNVYNPGNYNYQGTAVNANNANIQTRAAGLLANRANKLSLSGYKTQY